ncbi:hypothetical protein [Rhodopseudomonas palustris]|uniref:Uncharacterized protein n=1 Tax=Rhodopseudomonas palustris (strain BisB18) TaxID=316056 RepID=Q215V4_RHOPB
MRRTSRLISAAVLIALGSALTGCGSTTGWDPTDMLDFLDTKKKLPGDRKPVFPEGVPGLEQGVPKHLYRGAVEEPQPDAAAAPAPVEEPKQRGSKSRTRSKPAVARAPAEPAPEEDGSTAAAPPAPRPAKQSRRRTTAPPPDEPAATTTTAPAQQSSQPFPAPLPGGSFQR